MAKSPQSNVDNGRKPKSMSRFSYTKFMQLAQNSYKKQKYGLVADNCRLAVEYALQQNKLEAATQAYRLWIHALMESGKFKEVKKVCCSARSIFGNLIDLLYYEFKASQMAGEKTIAAKIAREFIETSRKIDKSNHPWFSETIDKLNEVAEILDKLEDGRAEKNDEMRIAE
jgi:hypothetical protein